MKKKKKREKKNQRPFMEYQTDIQHHDWRHTVHDIKEKSSSLKHSAAKKIP